MWWLAIPVVLLGKIIYDAMSEDEKQEPPRELKRRKSTLELNLERLKMQLYSHPSYKVAILGQPGAGKSSLLKKMTKDKVIPLPIIGMETDATNWADDTECNLLSNYDNYVFADVPGYDTLSHPVHAFSLFFPFNRFDAFIFVIHGKLHASDENIFRLISQSNKYIIVVRSFSDGIDMHERLPIENDIRKLLALQKSIPVLFVSNRTGEGVDVVFNSIRS